MTGPTPADQPPRAPAADPATAHEQAAALTWLVSCDGRGRPRAWRSITAVGVATLLDAAVLPGCTASATGIDLTGARPRQTATAGAGAAYEAGVSPALWALDTLRPRGRVTWPDALNQIHPRCWTVAGEHCAQAGLTAPATTRSWFGRRRRLAPAPEARTLAAQRARELLDLGDDTPPATGFIPSDPVRLTLLALFLTDSADQTLPTTLRKPWTATMQSLHEAAEVNDALRALFLGDPAYEELSRLPWVLPAYAAPSH